MTRHPTGDGSPAGERAKAGAQAPAAALRERIGNRTARVGVIGLGYVGLPLAEVMARAGLSVTGIDVDPRKVAAISAGHTYIEDLTDADVAAQVDAGRLRATADFAALRELDVILICVPTPLRKTLDPDISYVVAASEQIRDHLQPGQLVVLESTTYPGTTDEVIRPMLEAGSLRVGEDVFLAFSPERVDPSNPVYKTENTPKVVGGVTGTCGELAAALYRVAIPEVHLVSSASAAEMVKLLENTFRLVNIGWINEFALIGHRLGIDVWEVIDAAATKPFGFMPFYPGPGLGGHCIPIDPHYLSWKLRSLNYFTRFIDLASEINRGMPGHVADRIAAILNEDGKAIRGSRVMAIGVAYKKNTGDTRESPAIDVLQILLDRGARLSYHDPHVPSLGVNGTPVERVALDAATLGSQDIVVILTDHDGVDYASVAAAAPRLFDTRNATRGIGDAGGRVVRL